MSNEAITWAIRQPVGRSSAKFVLVAMANLAGPDMKCWPSFPPTALSRLRRLAGKRMTGDDVLVITAQRLRTQEQNRRDALARVDALIEEALIQPKLRRATKPTRSSKERRLQTKQQRGAIKKGRGKPGSWD